MDDEEEDEDDGQEEDAVGDPDRLEGGHDDDEDGDEDEEEDNDDGDDDDEGVERFLSGGRDDDEDEGEEGDDGGRDPAGRQLAVDGASALRMELRRLQDEMAAMQALSRGEDAYVPVDISMGGGNTAAGRQAQQFLLQQLDGAGFPGGILEVRDLNLEHNAFITPPTRNAHGDFQMLMNIDMNSEDPLGDLSEIVARLGQQTAAGGGGIAFSTNVSSGQGYPGDAGAVSSGMNELLPQGVGVALQVAAPTIQHPMLSREGPAGRAPPAPTPALSNIGMGALFAGMQPPPQLQRRNAIGIGGVTPGQPHITRSNRSGMLQMSPFHSSADLPSGLLDMGGDEFDPTAPAVWPRYPASEGPHTRRGGGIAQADPSMDAVAQLVLQHIEENLIEGLELAEEAADDGSQESLMETSRGDGAQTEGGNSYSEQGSNIALQDPNPRRPGEADSRLGDPIPPIIEIDSPGHEGNEDMSVITLAQDDASRTEHDDTSVGTGQESQQRPTPLPLPRNRSPSSRSPVHSVQFSSQGLPSPPAPVPGSPVAPAESQQAPVMPPTPPPVAQRASSGTAPEAVAGLPTSVAGIAFDSLLASFAATQIGPAAAPAAGATPAVESTAQNQETTSSRADATSATAATEQSAGAANASTEPQEPAGAAEEASSVSAGGTVIPITSAAEGGFGQSPDTHSPVFVRSRSADEGQRGEGSATSAPEGDGGRLACPPGYDADVFYLLPEEMQQEIIDQHSDQQSPAPQTAEGVDDIRALLEAAGLDYDAISELPESIRQEVIEQARSEQAASSRSANAEAGAGGSGAGAQDMDNATFLASLPPELRAEVLLTADAEFLATLPPELVAEAQAVRERAASNWQRRELSSRMGTREPSGTAGRGAPPAVAVNAAAGLAGPGEFYGDEDDDEEGDDEDDDGLDLDGAFNYRGASSHSPPRPRTEKPKTGLMRVPSSAFYNITIPSHLVLAIVRVLLNAPKQFTRVASAVRILQNVGTDLLSKDVNVKLLLSLVGGNPTVLTRALRHIAGPDAKATLLADPKSAVVSSEVVSKATLRAAESVASELDVEVSATAAQRILSVLAHLVSESNAFVYLLLASRDATFELADQETATKLQESVKPGTATAAASDAASDAKAGEVATGADTVADGKAVGDDEPVLKQPTSPLFGFGSASTGVSRVSSCSPRHAAAAASTNTLLEMVICLLGKPNIVSSATELDILAGTLSLVTLPLDQLRDEVEGDAPAVVSAELAARDAKLQAMSVPVPKVVLSKEALGYLCDVLLNDMCTKRVLLNVTSVISRLSRVGPNHALLLELIADVVVDLAQQSQVKLQGFVDTLKRIHETHAATKQTKAKSEEKGGSGKVGGLVPSSTSPFRAFRAPAPKIALPSSLLPLGESGAKQHERLLRVVHTLHSMAQNTKRQLSDVAPSDELTELWRALDNVLGQLRLYLVEDDSSEAEDNGAATRPQSALTSTLNRLLPVLEAFFLVHSSDLLADKPANATAPASSAAKAAPVSGAKLGADAPVTTVPPVLSRLTSSASTNNMAELIPASSMPGHSYRTSVAYLRNNISLFSDAAAAGGEEGAPSLQATKSLRKQPSFTSMNSRVYSVLTSKSHRLLQFAQSHKGLLNLVIKARPALLDDSLSAFVRVKEIRAFLKFDNKRKYFFAQLRRVKANSMNSRGIHLQIRRSQVFEDSFHQLRVRTAEELRGRLQVNFYGEEGVDAGGLTREWYVILAREIFNPNYALFTAAVDGATFQPNPLSIINSNHLDYFKFVGRLIGKAICDGQLLDAHFTR
jgi:hypothetical protein